MTDKLWGSLCALAAKQVGLITRRQAILAGYSDSGWDRLVAARSLTQLDRGLDYDARRAARALHRRRPGSGSSQPRTAARSIATQAPPPSTSRVPTMAAGPNGSAKKAAPTIAAVSGSR